LNDLGMKPAQAIRLFFRQIRLTRSIPFAIESSAAPSPAPAPSPITMP
jgi:antitoxin component of RelBE/YafQ-DinJ toxin-antitoxin module